MNNKFLSIFNNKKPIMGMLHLKGDDPDIVVAKAYYEAVTMIKNGIDAVIVENYFGNIEDVERVLQFFQKIHADFVYGVNVLRDDRENFRVATQYHVPFLQIDSVSGHLEPEEDIEFGKFINDCRKEYQGAVLGGVRFKYQPYKSGRTLEEDLKIGMERCDAIAVTGEGTGKLTPVEKLKEFREIVGDDFPLIVAAGVTPESFEKQCIYSDGIVVGSYLKDTYVDSGDVKAEHVRRFTEAINECWSKLDESNRNY